MVIMRRLLVLALTVLALAPSVASARPAVVGSVDARNKESPPAWILRAVFTGIIEWGVGVALDYGFGRTELVQLTRGARGEARRHLSATTLTSDDQRLLGRVDERLADVERMLANSTLRDEQVRSQIRGLERELRGLAREVDLLDARLFQVELEQRRQLRMIVDDRGRILRLEGQVVDLQGHVVDLTDRVTALEREVFLDPRRFWRHEAYLSFELLFASPDEPAKNGDIGAALNYQYNITRFLGVSGSGYFLPVYAESIDNPDPPPEPRRLDLYWTNFAASGGPVFNLLPTHSPVSLQVGGGLVFMLSYLGATGEDEGFWFSEHWEKDTRVIPNFGTTGSARLGFAPPLYPWEAVLSVGVIDLFKDFHTVTITSAQIRQPQLWYLGAAVRIRDFRR